MTNQDVFATAVSTLRDDEYNLGRLMDGRTRLALASWLGSWIGVEVDEHGPSPEDWRHALDVARAYLGLPDGVMLGRLATVSRQRPDMGPPQTGAFDERFYVALVAALVRKLGGETVVEPGELTDAYGTGLATALGRDGSYQLIAYYAPPRPEGGSS